MSTVDLPFVDRLSVVCPFDVGAAGSGSAVGYGRLGELAWLILPAILCYGILLWIMGFRRHHIVK